VLVVETVNLGTLAVKVAVKVGPVAVNAG